MTNIHVVVDSTAHISPKLLAQYSQLHVVPIQVIIGDKQWPEGQLNWDDLFRISRKTGYHP